MSEISRGILAVCRLGLRELKVFLRRDVDEAEICVGRLCKREKRARLIRYVARYCTLCSVGLWLVKRQERGSGLSVLCWTVLERVQFNSGRT